MLTSCLSKDFWGKEPNQRASSRGAETIDIDAAHAAFAEWQSPLRAQQSRGKFTEIWFVAHERDAPAFDTLAERGQHGGRLVPRRQLVERSHCRPVFETGRQQVRSLTGAYQRARVDLVDLHAKPGQPLHHFFETADTGGGQRTFGVVGPLLTTLGRDGVADEVELTGSHARGI